MLTENEVIPSPFAPTGHKDCPEGQVLRSALPTVELANTASKCLRKMSMNAKSADGEKKDIYLGKRPVYKRGSKGL